MKDEKRNPIGYRTVTRMEEERQEVEETMTDEATENQRSAQEQAAQDHFETGGWQDDAEKTVNDKKRMDDLCDKEEEFTHKKGLSRIRKQLILLWSYVKAVVSGKYTGYSTWAFVKATAGLLYVVSPFDMIPDFFPWVGWADDVVVILYVCNLLGDELKTFSEWQVRQRMAAER